MDDGSALAIDRKDLIEGLGKGLRVIEAFDDDHPRLTPSEVAQLTGLSRSVAAHVPIDPKSRRSRRTATIATGTRRASVREQGRMTSMQTSITA